MEEKWTNKQYWLNKVSFEKLLDKVMNIDISERTDGPGVTPITKITVAFWGSKDKVLRSFLKEETLIGKTVLYDGMRCLAVELKSPRYVGDHKTFDKNVLQFPIALIDLATGEEVLAWKTEHDMRQSGKVEVVK